jgi:hypothetical protein
VHLQVQATVRVRWDHRASQPPIAKVIGKGILRTVQREEGILYNTHNVDILVVRVDADLLLGSDVRSENILTKIGRHDGL